MTLKFTIAVKTDKFPQWMTKFPEAIAGALEEEAQEILSASQMLVPVETGALKNSGGIVREDQPNGSVVIRIGYGGPAASYAETVHETPPPAHAGKQARGTPTTTTASGGRTAFHAPPTQWKYLETPFINATRGQQRRLVERTRQVLEANGFTYKTASTFGAEESSGYEE